MSDQVPEGYYCLAVFVAGSEAGPTACGPDPLHQQQSRLDVLFHRGWRECQ